MRVLAFHRPLQGTLCVRIDREDTRVKGPLGNACHQIVMGNGRVESCVAHGSLSVVVGMRGPLRAQGRVVSWSGYAGYCQAFGATVRPRTLCLAIVRATSPVALMSSMKAHRYRAPAGRPFGVPAACWTAGKLPARGGGPGKLAWSVIRRGRTPARASNLSVTKRLNALSAPCTRTSSPVTGSVAVSRK